MFYRKHLELISIPNLNVWINIDMNAKDLLDSFNITEQLIIDIFTRSFSSKKEIDGEENDFALFDDDRGLTIFFEKRKKVISIRGIIDRMLDENIG